MYGIDKGMTGTAFGQNFTCLVTKKRHPMTILQTNSDFDHQGKNFDNVWSVSGTESDKRMAH